jgi:2,3-bisphosphoglycerate-independent phosphoglycerate mutase
MPAAFPPLVIKNTLAEVISRAGIKQLHIAETEKYAHVTFFFNGGVEEPFEGEDRVLVPSPSEVATYDQKPAMSANEVTNGALDHLAPQPIWLYGDELCQRRHGGAYWRLLRGP